MSPVRRRTAALAIIATFLLAWLAPPGHALTTTTGADRLVTVTIPSTAGATHLWVDLEAANLQAHQAVVRVAGRDVPVKQSPFGVTAIIEGAPATVDVGLRRAGQAKVAITLADAAGRILHSDAETISFMPYTGKPLPQPPGTPDKPGKPRFERTAPYTLPGLHTLNGRQWNTACEQYSQTERCRTEIWATVVLFEKGKFTRTTGWAFNNLTYLPYMSEAAWQGNPLAVRGDFDSAGRQWRTECHTPATGRGACRSYTMTTVYTAIARPSGGYEFSQSNEWVFNNIVMFGDPSMR